MKSNPYEAPKAASQASVHFGLRALGLILAVQLPLSWLVFQLLSGGDLFRSVAGVAVFAVTTVATWISLWPERRFRRELAQRESLDETRFINEFYAQTDVRSDIPLRLRPIYCNFFEIEVGKLRPEDRPPEIGELDTADLVHAVEAEFGITLSDQDLERIDGSFDSIVRHLAYSSR